MINYKKIAAIFLKAPLCLLCVAVFSLISSCEKSGKVLKIAAAPVPHAQMLEFVKDDLKAQGVDLRILVTDDYNLPNRALAYREVDANFFQHIPFMEQQIAEFHFPIMSLAKIHIEPMGVYSRKVSSLNDLKDGALISIPNDPTNEYRALALFHESGLIKLDDIQNLRATVLNIVENPKGLKFQEIDAAMLPRTLSDVDAAAIPTNFALQADLSPLKDAIAIESKNSPYVNIIAIRNDEINRQDLQILKEAMTSEKMREFILTKYQGAVIPVF